MVSEVCGQREVHGQRLYNPHQHRIAGRHEGGGNAVEGNVGLGC